MIASRGLKCMVKIPFVAWKKCCLCILLLRSTGLSSATSTAAGSKLILGRQSSRCFWSQQGLVPPKIRFCFLTWLICFLISSGENSSQSYKFQLSAYFSCALVTMQDNMSICHWQPAFVNRTSTKPWNISWQKYKTARRVKKKSPFRTT